MNEGQWVKVLEDCVIKAHKTASLTSSRKVCCCFSPSLHAGHLLKDLFPRSVVGACHHWATCSLLWALREAGSGMQGEWAT